MVAIDKIQKGLVRYADAELLPKMQGKDRWVITGFLTLLAARIPEIVRSAADQPAIKLLGIVGSDGSVDIESLLNSIRPAARQSPAVLSIPFGGDIKFSEADLDTLYSYIVNA